MLSKILRTWRLVTRWANDGYRLVPPCSIKAKWNAAVLAIAWIWSSGLRSASVMGIAGNFPLLKLGIAWGNVKLGSRSGLLSRLRYRVHQLVSTVSCVRFVSRLPMLLGL